MAGLKEAEMELLDGATVASLLEELLERFGEPFRRYVYNEATGKPKTYLHFLVDGKDLSAVDGFETKLRHGQTVAIVAAVGGGQ